MSLEIGLPHVIRPYLFKPFVVCGSLTGSLAYEIVPVKDIIDCSGAGKVWIAIVIHDLSNLHCSQSRIFLPHAYNVRFHCRRDSSCLNLGRPALIWHGLPRQKSTDPLIACRTADTVFTAQSSFTLLHAQCTLYKFFSHYFHSPFLPSHLHRFLFFWDALSISKL